MTEYDDHIISKINAAVSFPVDVVCEDYPDVVFDITFNTQLDNETIEKVVTALINYMISYNKWHFLRPIHYVSDIESLPDVSSEYSICIHMDCGNADPKLLIGAVKAIADTKIPIERITIY